MTLRFFSRQKAWKAPVSEANSSEEQTGWMKVVPYPTSNPISQAPLTVDSIANYPQSGYSTSDNYGGNGLQVMRGKLLWKASDKLTFTLAADWSHEDTTALGYTVLDTYSGNIGTSTFSSLYNTCISNNAATITGAVTAGGAPPPLIGLEAGLCSQPRAQIPGLSQGSPALLGAGYVGGPVGPYNYLNTGGAAYLGSSSPRIYWNNAAVNTGNIDTTYAADGPDFARYDLYGGALTGVYNLSAPILGPDGKALAALTVPYITLVNQRGAPDITQTIELLLATAEKLSRLAGSDVNQAA